MKRGHLKLQRLASSAAKYLIDKNVPGRITNFFGNFLLDAANLGNIVGLPPGLTEKIVEYGVKDKIVNKGIEGLSSFGEKSEKALRGYAYSNKWYNDLYDYKYGKKTPYRNPSSDEKKHDPWRWLSSGVQKQEKPEKHPATVEEYIPSPKDLMLYEVTSAPTTTSSAPKSKTSREFTDKDYADILKVINEPVLWSPPRVGDKPPIIADKSVIRNSDIISDIKLSRNMNVPSKLLKKEYDPYRIDDYDSTPFLGSNSLAISERNQSTIFRTVAAKRTADSSKLGLTFANKQKAIKPKPIVKKSSTRKEVVPTRKEVVPTFNEVFAEENIFANEPDPSLFFKPNPIKKKVRAARKKKASPNEIIIVEPKNKRVRGTNKKKSDVIVIRPNVGSKSNKNAELNQIREIQRKNAVNKTKTKFENVLSKKNIA